MTNLGMHWLDLTVMGVLGAAMIAGAVTGFIRQIIRLATFVAATYGSMHGHEPVHRMLKDTMGDAVPFLPRIIAVGITFLVITIAIWVFALLVRKWWQLVMPEPCDRPALGLKGIDRLLGAGVSGLLASLIVCPVIFGLQFIPDPKAQAKLEGSQVRPLAHKTTNAFIEAIPQCYKAELAVALDRVKRQGLEAAGELGGRATREATQGLNQLSHEIESTKGANLSQKDFDNLRTELERLGTSQKAN